jgi:kinetochore protein Spc25, fungi type
MAHVLRLPQIDLAAVLAESSPHIDLRLDVYESSTRNFLKAVANYKNRAVATLSARRANHVGENKKVLEKTQAVEAEAIQCKLAEIELVAGTSQFLVCLTTTEGAQI